MSATATPVVARGYDLHGVALVVRAVDPEVLAVVDERLRGFPRVDGRPPRDAVGIDFVPGDPASSPRPGGVSRPVYDTPYGEVEYFAGEDVLFGELAGVQLHCAAGRGRVRLRAASFAGRALYLATHPLLTIALMEVLERRGRFSLHAACLARGDAGALLAGPSGSGKSTLTFALAAAGLDVVSDDVVFLAHGDGDGGAVRVLGFADALGITASGAELFPGLRPLLADAPRDGFPKRLVRAERALPKAAVRGSCAPRALVFPTVAAGSPSALAPLDPGAALLRLVPDVLLTDPEATRAHLGAIAALLDQVATYELRSGADLHRAAQLVTGTLAV